MVVRPWAVLAQRARLFAASVLVLVACTAPGPDADGHGPAQDVDESLEVPTETEAR